MGSPFSLLRHVHAPIYAARLRELVRQLIPHIRAGDRILDVGCGFGALGRAVLDDPACPENVDVRGLERFQREEQLIPVDEYDGTVMPFEDDSFDIVILADVLHHEEQPDRLIDECRRVTRRLLIIKDHKVEGLLGQFRISLIDWAANAPFSVKCLYRYNTLEQWRASHERHGLAVDTELTSMKLYPPFVNLLFGRRLQYMVVLEKKRRSDAGAAAS